MKKKSSVTLNFLFKEFQKKKYKALYHQLFCQLKGPKTAYEQLGNHRLSLEG